MSPYATIALLALVLSVAAQDNVQRTHTINTNVNWNKQTNSAVGNVNVNGKNTPFTVSISAAPNQRPTFTFESQNPAGKTTTVKIIPIKPIVANMPAQSPTEPPKPIHHDVPVPIKSAAPIPPTPTPNKPVVVSTFASSSFTSTTASSSSSTSTFTSTTSEPGKPTVTVRSQTYSSSADPKPVTVTVVSMTKPMSEPVKVEPSHPTFHPIPSPAPVPTPAPAPLPAVDNNVDTTTYTVQRTPEPEHKRRGCNKRLWIKGIILGLAAFGALAFLALCCRICRGRSHCCCRRRHRGCEGNPTYGIPAPVPMTQIGQPQVFVVQSQPVNDPYFQPTPSNTNRSGQPFVQLNETNPDVQPNYVIGYPQPNEQPVYVIPHRQ